MHQWVKRSLRKSEKRMVGGMHWHVKRYTENVGRGWWGEHTGGSRGALKKQQEDGGREHPKKGRRGQQGEMP